MRIAVMLVVLGCSKTPSKDEPAPIDCTAERPRVAAAWNTLTKWVADRERKISFQRTDNRMVAQAMTKLERQGPNAAKVVAAIDAEVAAGAAIVRAGDEAAKAWQAAGDASKLHAAGVLAVKAYATTIHTRHQQTRTTQADIVDDMTDNAKYIGSNAVAKATADKQQLGDQIKQDKPDSEVLLAELAKLEAVAGAALACR